MYKNLDQYGNTVVLEFDLDELVAELAAHGTCRGELATRNVKYFKNVFNFFLLSYPSIKISALNFHAELEMNVILFIIKIVIIVY